MESRRESLDGEEHEVKIREAKGISRRMLPSMETNVAERNGAGPLRNADWM